MDCELIDGALIEFHFGTLESSEQGVTRASVEEHLVGCSPCLRSYLALKRAAEIDDLIDADSSVNRPSEVARLRLREAVAAEFGGPRARRDRLAKQPDRRAARDVQSRSILRRWVVGGAAAAIVLAVLAGALDFAAHRRAAKDSNRAVDIDSAGSEPANLRLL